jgi:hypothetical protein
MHNPFKVGDTVKVKLGLGKILTVGSIHTISRINKDNYIHLDSDVRGWYPERFELVKRLNTVSFEVWEWSEWVDDIVGRLKKELRYDFDGNPFAEVTVEDLLFSSKLDPDNPLPFCNEYMVSNIYENHIFVKHYKEKDCYWYINSDSTTLIYKPKLIKT